MSLLAADRAELNAQRTHYLCFCCTCVFVLYLLSDKLLFLFCICIVFFVTAGSRRSGTQRTVQTLSLLLLHLPRGNSYLYCICIQMSYCFCIVFVLLLLLYLYCICIYAGCLLQSVTIETVSCRRQGHCLCVYTPRSCLF